MEYLKQKELGEELCPPVSPISQSLSSSKISLVISVVFELETPMTESETIDFLRDIILPTTTRFSSIILTDKKGVKRWKTVDVQLEDHLIVPTFPSGLDRKGNDDYLRNEYLSKLSSERFSENKPLWEVHLIKYPTFHGAGSLIFKFHHAIGDGYSFLKVFLSSSRRADNPSLPHTFPPLSLGKSRKGKNLLGTFVTCKNTVVDLVLNLLKSTVLEDHPSAIRSSVTEKETQLFRPINVYSLSLSLERVKQVKSKLKATMNDVITGLISYIIHLYTARVSDKNSTNDKRMTLLVMLNMRVFEGYKTIDDMMKADAWGNRSRFMHATIPSFKNVEEVNPLDFILKAKKTMERKKNSMLYFIIENSVNITRKIKGQKGLDKIVHSGFKNATTMVTSLIGPREQITFASHPVNNLFFIVTGVPQSITFTSVSCMEKMSLVVTMEKGFIDYKIFISCMDEAFENIFQAAFENESKFST